MAVPAPRSRFGPAHRRRAPQAVLVAAALALPLASCSFDLGSWGSDDKPKAPAAAAEKPADTITSQDISTAKDHAVRGGVLVRSGKTDEALSEFDQALAADPYNIQALYGRGLIYQGRGQHQQAIEDFTAASGLSPQKVEPLLGRATSYLALDKAKEAAADLDEAVQADPSSVGAWTARGQAYERLGDKAKASASYNRALALRPKDEAARSGLARTGG
ncbi:tetratricopeptide repeat protein [Bradyrhizobium sp. WSM 1704]|nr:tetratricopeptide repeat protein [Bradyrhizobium semiaridum]